MHALVQHDIRALSQLHPKQSTPCCLNVTRFEGTGRNSNVYQICGRGFCGTRRTLSIVTCEYLPGPCNPRPSSHCCCVPRSTHHRYVQRMRLDYCPPLPAPSLSRWRLEVDAIHGVTATCCASLVASLMLCFVQSSRRVVSSMLAPTSPSLAQSVAGQGSTCAVHMCTMGESRVSLQGGMRHKHF